jgi:hypothetical protein
MSKAEIITALKALEPIEQAEVLHEAFGLSHMEIAALLLYSDYAKDSELIAFTQALEGEAPVFPDEPDEFLAPYQEG